jgi:class 3 adenylate cyclase
MIRIIIIMISTLIISGDITLYSQSSEKVKLDSLYLKMKYAKKTTVKVDLLNEISAFYWELNKIELRDSQQYYNEMAVKLARNAKYTQGLALSLFNLGKFHISFTNNYSVATPLLLEGMELYEILKDSSGISKCYLQLGLISYILQYYEDAIKNFRLSLNYSESTTPEYLIALSYTELDSIASAKKYFSLAISDYKNNDNQFMLNSCYMYMGKLFLKAKKTDSALYYLNLSIEQIKKEFNHNLLVRPYAFISAVYLEMNNLSKAIDYAETAYRMSLKSIDRISQMEAATTLSRAYELTGNYKKAFFYLNFLNTSKESFFKGSTKQKVAEMQSTFEFKKKRENDSLLNEKEKLNRELIFQKTLQDKKNERNIFLFGGIAILLMAGGLWSRLRYIRNTTKIIQQEKARSENLLLNILPLEVAEELKAKGSAAAKHFDNVTVMLTDFVNFTQQVSNMSPQALIDELHTCFKKFDEIIKKYKIEKIKTSGDSYLAVCGLPVPTPDHAVNMINAAIEINEFLRERFEQLGDKTFTIRIGINSGSVIAGIVGVNKFAYDIWGDTVNTAARMEQNSESGKINISGSTYELVKEKFHCTYRGKIEAKNKGEIDMYYIND